MTTTSKYSSDVENLTIQENVPTWNRERTHEELSSFVERHLSVVGELDASEYEFVA
jgi:hypothetical protein